MNAPFLRTLAIGVLLASLLVGCATPVVRQDTMGVPNAENPEYLGHPLRMLALGVNLGGNLIQYGLVEPFYFALTPVPEAVGLSLEERAYLAEREKAWRQYWTGERPAVR